MNPNNPLFINNASSPVQHTPLKHGENALLSITHSLLTLIIAIKNSNRHYNVPTLRAQIIEDIKNVERQLVEHHYPIRTIISARYLLCTAIDEAVLGCPWGTNSIWVQESLLSLFQKETYGGERFYLILEHMLGDVSHNIDCIELIYSILSLGFEGKLFGDVNAAARESTRNRVFGLIREVRNKPDRLLSPNCHSNPSPQWHKASIQKTRKIIAASLVFIFIIVMYNNYKTYTLSAPILSTIKTIADISPITVFSQAINRPSIRRYSHQQDSPQ
jgi:type VI secretion system protein ImpK